MDDALVERLRRAGCVFAEDEARILREEAATGADLESMTIEREAGVPLEHVVGWADFAGVRVPVDRGVFVPRPRSALVVEVSAELLSGGDQLLDLCCGSGGVGLAIAARVPVDVTATDVDAGAVANARRTLAAVGGAVYRGDLFDGVPRTLLGRFAVVAVVAPYVPRDAIKLLPHEARDFEPHLALDGGPDGLAVLRRIVADVGPWLAPGGALVAEVGDDQVDAFAAILTAEGFRARIHDHDGAIAVAAWRASD